MSTAQPDSHGNNQDDAGNPRSHRFSFDFSITFSFGGSETLQDEIRNAAEILKTLRKVALENQHLPNVAVDLDLNVTQPTGEDVTAARFGDDVIEVLESAGMSVPKYLLGHAAKDTVRDIARDTAKDAARDTAKDAAKSSTKVDWTTKLPLSVQHRILDLLRPQRVFTPVNMFQRLPDETVCRFEPPPFSRVCRKWRDYAHENGRMFYFFETFMGWEADRYSLWWDKFGQLQRVALSSTAWELSRATSTKPRAYACWIDLHNDILQYPETLSSDREPGGMGVNAYQMRYLAYQMRQIALSSTWLSERIQTFRREEDYTDSKAFQGNAILGFEFALSHVERIYIAFDQRSGCFPAGVAGLQPIQQWADDNMERNLKSRVIFDLRNERDHAQLMDLDGGGLYEGYLLQDFLTAHAHSCDCEDGASSKVNQSSSGRSSGESSKTLPISRDSKARDTNETSTTQQQGGLEQTLRVAAERGLQWESQASWLWHAIGESGWQRREPESPPPNPPPRGYIQPPDFKMHLFELGTVEATDLLESLRTAYSLCTLESGTFALGPHRWESQPWTRERFAYGPLRALRNVRSDLKKTLMWWNELMLNNPRRSRTSAIECEPRPPGWVPDIVPCVLIVDPEMQGQDGHMYHGHSHVRPVRINADMRPRQDRATYDECRADLFSPPESSFDGLFTQSNSGLDDDVDDDVLRSEMGSVISTDSGDKADDEYSSNGEKRAYEDMAADSLPASQDEGLRDPASTWGPRDPPSGYYTWSGIMRENYPVRLADEDDQKDDREEHRSKRVCTHSVSPRGRTMKAEQSDQVIQERPADTGVDDLPDYEDSAESGQSHKSPEISTPFPRVPVSPDFYQYGEQDDVSWGDGSEMLMFNEYEDEHEYEDGNEDENEDHSPNPDTADLRMFD